MTRVRRHLGDALLVSLAVLMIVATAVGEARRPGALRSRAASDRRAVATYLDRHGQPGGFAGVRVVRTLGGLDVACAAGRRAGPLPGESLCLLLRRSGPTGGRVVGGYRRRPGRRAARRYGCFGRATTTGLCSRATPARTGAA